MSFDKEDTNIRLGVILPTYYTSKIITDVILILDENNILWQAPKSVIDSSPSSDDLFWEPKMKIKPHPLSFDDFELVYFKYEESGFRSYKDDFNVWKYQTLYDITYINDFNDLHRRNTGYIRTVDKYGDPYSPIPVKEINNVDFKYSRCVVWKVDPLMVIGYLREDYTLHNSDDYSRKFAFPDDDIIHKRYFILDNDEGAYREITSRFIEVINQFNDSNNFMRTELPISNWTLTQLKEIIEKVTSFNPYEAFESFRIKDGSSTVLHTDFFGNKITDNYTYKTYSMSFFDDYMNNWFPSPTIRQSDGFDDHGAYRLDWGDKDFHRYGEEENQKKERAYAEYNKQEHFDCLMYFVYRDLKKVIDNSLSKKVRHQQFRCLSDYLKIKNVYYLLNMYLPSLKGYRMTEKEYKEKLEDKLDDIIEQINKELCI